MFLWFDTLLVNYAKITEVSAMQLSDLRDKENHITQWTNPHHWNSSPMKMRIERTNKGKVKLPRVFQESLALPLSGSGSFCCLRTSPASLWKKQLCCTAAGARLSLPACTGLTTASQLPPGRLFNYTLFQVEERDTYFIGGDLLTFWMKWEKNIGPIKTC